MRRYNIYSPYLEAIVGGVGYAKRIIGLLVKRRWLSIWKINGLVVYTKLVYSGRPKLAVISWGGLSTQVLEHMLWDSNLAVLLCCKLGKLSRYINDYIKRLRQPETLTQLYLNFINLGFNGRQMLRESYLHKNSFKVAPPHMNSCAVFLNKHPRRLSRKVNLHKLLGKI